MSLDRHLNMCSHVQSKVPCVVKEIKSRYSPSLNLSLSISRFLFHPPPAFNIDFHTRKQQRHMFPAQFAVSQPRSFRSRIVSTERKPRRKRRNARRQNSVKSTASWDSLIEGERRDKTSTTLYPPLSFSFKEAPHPSYKVFDAKRALISRTETRRRET